MLEKLKFNSKLFRYRNENDEQLLLYNVKYGQIYLIKGKAKKFILSYIEKQQKNDKQLSIDNKYIEFFKENKILEE